MLMKIEGEEKKLLLFFSLEENVGRVYKENVCVQLFQVSLYKTIIWVGERARAHTMKKVAFNSL